MTFKLIKKKHLSLPMDVVSLTNYGFSFGDEAKAFLGDFKFLEVYYDKENSLVGFKPSDNSDVGYRILKGFNHPTVSRAGLSKSLENGRYKYNIENGLIVICVDRSEK